MELKEGMYARIDNDFRSICVGIGKITKIAGDIVYVQKREDMSVFCFKDQIEKASFNLINLVEVGDYINGEKVTSAEAVYEMDNERYLGFGNYDRYICESKQIKNIVTKEQFDLMKYVAEGDK